MNFFCSFCTCRTTEHDVAQEVPCPECYSVSWWDPSHTLKQWNLWWASGSASLTFWSGFLSLTPSFNYEWYVVRLFSLLILFSAEYHNHDTPQLKPCDILPMGHVFTPTIQTPFEIAGISRNIGEHMLITRYKCLVQSLLDCFVIKRNTTYCWKFCCIQ